MAKIAHESCVAGGRSYSANRAMERSSWTASSVNDGPFTTETLLESGGRLVHFPEDWHERNRHGNPKTESAKKGPFITRTWQNSR